MLPGAINRKLRAYCIEIMGKKIHRLAEVGVPLARKFFKKAIMDEYCKMMVNIPEKYYL
jgi:hypothetical protein